MYYVEFLTLAPTRVAGVYDTAWHRAGAAFGGFPFPSRADARRYAQRHARGRAFRITHA